MKMARLAVFTVLALTGGGLATAGDPPPAPKSSSRVEPLAIAPRLVDRFGDPLPAGALLRLGTTRLRHADVCAFAFTADKKLVSFGRDYVLRTWDPETGRQLSERAFEKDKIHRFSAGYLSADASRVAIQLGEQLKVFEVASGRELAAVKLTDQFEARAKFSPDGNRLVVGEQEGKVHICDVSQNTCQPLGKVSGPPRDFAFSRDGQKLALADLNSGTVVWDLAKSRELIRFKLTGLSAMSVDFDGTGDVLAVLGSTNPPQPFQFARVSTGQAPDGWTAPTVGDVHWVRFVPDGSTVVLGRKDRIEWYDPKVGKTIRTATGPATVRPTFSPNGKLIASGGRNVIRVWDSESGKSVVPANLTDAPADEVHGVAVSPDRKWIVTKGWEEGIRIWNADGMVKAFIRSHRWSGRHPVFSADGKSLFAGAPDAVALARWDLSNGKETIRYTFAEPATDQASIYNFAVSADGRRIAALTQTINRAGAGGRIAEVATVTVWDVVTGNRVHTQEEVERADWFAYGAFSPDLRWYYIGHRTMSLDGGPESRLDIPAGWRAWHAAVSPDGRLVAQTASEQLKKQVDGRPWYWSEDRGIVVHEAATGKQVLNLSVKECGAMAFTLDSRGLVVTDVDAITVWDLATQKTLLRHKAPSRFVGSYGPSFASSLKITPDGTKAVTGHIDTTALVWDLSVPARRVRQLSERELAAAWADLAGDDAARAYAAIWSLADAPGDSVRFLRTRLRPAVAPTEDEVRKLVGRLDALAFADREGAEKALRELGESVASDLRDRLKAGVSPEQKERIEKVLAAAAIPTLTAGDRLRQVRGVAALELAGTVDARKMLEELSRGAAEDRLTKEAAAVLQRLR